MELAVDLDPGQRQVDARPATRSPIQFPNTSSISSPFDNASTVNWKAW
jgi:hypothetical protein